MGNFSYPLAVTEGLQVTRLNRVLSDTFENGTTAARRLWSNKTFKRRFRVSHAPLTALELDTLQGFWSQRNGPYDSFWFRDNVNREGNATVRFAGPLVVSQQRGVRRVEVEMEEVAPIIQNPSLHELKLATQQHPIFWWDANRSVFYSHVNPLSITLENYIHCQVGLYKPLWTPASILPSNPAGQWQHWRPFLTNYAVTNETIPLASGQPGFTLFGFFRHSVSAVKQVVAGIGTVSAGAAMGLVLSQVNVYEPWIGGGETWTGAVFTNSPADTWRSIAVVFNSGTNDVALYVNGTVVGVTNANARSFAPGRASFGAAMNGTNPVNNLGTMVNADGNHVIAFDAVLSTVFIREIHNLFAYQYGLPTV